MAEAALEHTQSGTFPLLKCHFSPTKVPLFYSKSAVFAPFSLKNMTEYDRK